MTATTRVERDSLGSLDVPAEALWGAQTQRAIENFPPSGLRMPRAFIEALALIKHAAAGANAELGDLPQAIAAAIQEAALKVAAGAYDDQFPVDVFQTGSGTSSNMNANEVIASLASRALGAAVHPNDQVNMSQSSNDVVPTAIHVVRRVAAAQITAAGAQALAGGIGRARRGAGRYRQDRPHAFDGCHAHHAGPGARRLAVANRLLRSSLDGGDAAAACAGAGRYGGGHGHQCKSAIRRAFSRGIWQSAAGLLFALLRIISRRWRARIPPWNSRASSRS